MGQFRLLLKKGIQASYWTCSSATRFYMALEIMLSKETQSILLPSNQRLSGYEKYSQKESEIVWVREIFSEGKQ
jgi:hypothetical protein